jgi:hypothetical protein
MMPISTSRLLRKRGSPPEGPAEVQDVDVGNETRADRWIVCAQCRQPIARSGDRIRVGGQHLHTCVNPHGFVYRIALFRRADGVVAVGEWSDEHTWFAGRFWQIVCCQSCSIHLGWSFTGEGEDFHGLIVERVEEADEPS